MIMYCDLWTVGIVVRMIHQQISQKESLKQWVDNRHSIARANNIISEVPMHSPSVYHN